MLILKNFSISQKNSNNSIFKNMLILATGAGFAQLINFVSMPIVTRIYSPSDIGILSIFLAVVGILVPLSTLKYSIPIPLLIKDGTAINLFFGNIIILFITTFVVSIILYFCVDELFNFFSINMLSAYWILIPIAVFFLGFFEILNGLSLRRKSFKDISKANSIPALSGALIKIILGFLDFKPIGLLVGTLLINISASIFLLKSNYKFIQKNIRYVNLKRIIFLIKRFSEFPKYRLPSQFLLVFSKQAPLFFFTSMFSAEIVGYFALTAMALSVPLTLLGNTTGQAYYAEIAKIGNNDSQKVFDITKNVTKKLFFLGLIPFLIILLLSPFLFSTIFGEKWFTSGEYASILSFYMLTAFASSPLVHTLNIYKSQLRFLWLNVLRLLVLVFIFGLSWFFNSTAKETVVFYSIGMSLYFIYMSFFIFKTIKLHIKAAKI